MKKLLALALAFCLILLFTSCENKEAAEGKESRTTLDVYRFYEGGNSYSLLPVACESDDLTDIINLAASSLEYVKEPLPIASVSEENGKVTVTFYEEYTDIYPYYQIHELRNTIAATLKMNDLGSSFFFTIENRNGALGEEFTPDTPNVIYADAEKCKAITDAIPYRPPYIYSLNKESYESFFGREPDDTEMEIYTLLMRVGKIEESASSPDELNKTNLYSSLLAHTSPCYIDEREPEGYYPELLPVADLVSAKTGNIETMFWIADHLRETAKIIFGDDFYLDLSSFNEHMPSWHYFKEENVIVPPHSGGSFGSLPFVKSCTQNDEGVNAEIIYLFENMNGISPWEEEKSLTPNEVKDYLEKTDKIVNVKMGREKDGRLIFISCEMK